MGDPAGIGPEITVKALATPAVYVVARPLLFGDAAVISQAVQITGLDLKVRPIAKLEQAMFRQGTIDVLDLCNVNIASLQLGHVSAMAGKAAFEAITRAIDAALARQIDAVVTNPINKEAINLAGYHFAGHTEIFALFTKTKDYTMMLVEQNLRVVHVSTHVSMRQACDLVRKDRILTVIKLAHDTCRSLGIESPLIGVAALNPHAGDGGLFGTEEHLHIIPAVEAATEAGIHAEGPFPADTLFAKAKAGAYDVVVAMYHDQGHIPLKMLGFNWNQKEKKWDAVRGINITLGLPIIRTSVDHGTAFDQAGKATASADSLLAAIEYAARMAAKRESLWKTEPSPS
jgi:4-hydroxythreonine-4-phosphate dehydrogenase